MVVKILAWDHSGSTINEDHYHSCGRKYVQKFSCEELDSDQDKKIYLRWDTSCAEITFDELISITDRKHGAERGTDPSSLVEWILKHIYKDGQTEPIDLWLITDGEIGREELARCARLNEKVNYVKINFIVINKRKINMSVGASFFRGAELNIFCNSQLFKFIDFSSPLDYDSITIDNFDQKWSGLNDFIQAKFMGSDMESLEEVEKLNALRRRLLKKLAENPEANFGDQYFPIFSSHKKSHILSVLKTCKFYRTLVNPALRNMATMIDASISTLINYIHNEHKSYEFSSLKMEVKENKLEIVEEEIEPQMSSLNDAEACSFYDAVTLEDEHAAPILLLTVTDLIEKYWENGNFSKFRAIMDCPFLAKIDECIGHVYLIETFKFLCKNDYGYIVNPMTNQPVFGGLIFSEAADRWNDYVLFKTFFRGKKVNTNIALWYYKIWKHTEGKEWIEPDIVAQLKNYAFRRLANAKVRLGFSTLPLEPKEIVDLPIACFYCTEGSSLLFGEHSTIFLQEKLRQYWPVTEYFLEILDYFGYNDINRKFVLNRAKTFELMSQLKRIPQEIEKRYFLLKQVFESQNKFLTYKVKDKSALQFLNLLHYHQKNSVIPFNYGKKLDGVHVMNIVLISYESQKHIDIKISPDTFRPYFVVEEESGLVPYYNQLRANMTDISLDWFGRTKIGPPVVKIDHRRVISICKCYVDLANILKKFPTLEELSDYIYKTLRLNENSRVRLFPLSILNDIKYIFDLYSNLDVSIEEFRRKTNNSVSIEARIVMEKTLSKTDVNVDNFISIAKSGQRALTNNRSSTFCRNMGQNQSTLIKFTLAPWRRESASRFRE